MRQVKKGNSLADKFPHVALEWHPTKNGDITPGDVPSKSNKKYWFRCEKGHEWEANVYNRTSPFRGISSNVGAGCPYCHNKKVCHDNCLETRYPEIAKEWHPTKNGDITPKDVIAMSHKKYWFRCKKGHEWGASLAHRANNRGCPYCSNKKVCYDNCLETCYPEISKEWHPTKNGNTLPRNTLPGIGKKYWFKCYKGHEWDAYIYSRTGPPKTGCPYCNVFKTQEKVREIFEKLSNKKFPQVRPLFLDRLEYDGANEELKLAWEYDGKFHDIAHHASKNPVEDLKKSKERDARKDRLSVENGWTLIRVHHSKKDRLEEYIKEELIKLNLLKIDTHPL